MQERTSLIQTERSVTELTKVLLSKPGFLTLHLPPVRCGKLVTHDELSQRLKPKQNPSRVKLRSRLLVGVTMPTRSLSYAKTPNWSYPLAYTARFSADFLCAWCPQTLCDSRAVNQDTKLKPEQKMDKQIQNLNTRLLEKQDATKQRQKQKKKLQQLAEDAHLDLEDVVGLPEVEDKLKDALRHQSELRRTLNKQYTENAETERQVKEQQQVIRDPIIGASILPPPRPIVHPTGYDTCKATIREAKRVGPGGASGLGGVSETTGAGDDS
eukprot:1187398-Prorocentrum_minimum.AAC.1